MAENDQGLKAQRGLPNLVVREFELADKAEIQQIFYEGMMEMVEDTAFRGLRHHPESLLLYAAVTVVCFVITMCWWVIILLPAIVLCGRYFYSRRVIHSYLEHSMSRDMGDLEGFYMNSADSCMWVAVLGGKVVGHVAAVGQEPGGAVKLHRLSVDRHCRRCGVGVSLSQKVLEFALTRGYSSVFLGTIAYTAAPHRLYQRVGLRCVGVTNGYITPGAKRSLLEHIFYRVRIHHYSLDVQKLRLTVSADK
ncbi:N-acetylaspartate synthetase-like [Cottoperca gobio]|uniref:N-acetylaspartate synthetase n=1 Tax=Cottoperca gobio TaxID=56716 RepID=A0A6J2QE99_COTGO|nr:N-acetylaspartate synthetase-like [Cottoperca gobio]XP_029296297.1 N-acetylaspartate synthetase-like [Cottoperca gobio]XP_029296305.1 N-acetylaspartate synthetase-like [Cottoperca gobio]XP_029296314.1 N-acetylaspartate synthetase-like [Cottoperca gobio]